MMSGSTHGGVWGPAGLGGGSMGGGGRPRATLDGKGFADVPAELHDGVSKILAMEPAWEEPDLAFSYQISDRRPLTVRRVLALRRPAIVGLAALLVVETVSLQAGPALIQIGLDHGVLAHNGKVLIAAGLTSVVAVIITVIVS